MIALFSPHMTLFGRCIFGMVATLALLYILWVERRRGTGTPAERLWALPFCALIFVLFALNTCQLITTP
jgi:hypothetical protein